MKLKDSIITHKNETGYLLIGSGDETFNGIITLNGTGEFLALCLEEDLSLDEILNRFYDKYDGDKSQIKEEVIQAIEKLKEVNAIEY